MNITPTLGQNHRYYTYALVYLLLAQSHDAIGSGGFFT